MSLVIRPAAPEDSGAILRLIRELAEYEREPLSNLKVTEADIRRDGFGPDRRFEALLADLDGEVVGFALYFPNWSTWEGRAGLHVEDLFVSARARRGGVGRRLLAEIARIAEARGYGRVDLNVLDWNPARRFYERLGFAELAEWRAYRLAGPAIGRLADEARAAGSGSDDLGRREPRRGCAVAEDEL